MPEIEVKALTMVATAVTLSAISCLLWAVLLRLAARWVEDIRMGFGSALVTVIAAWILSVPINFMLGAAAPLFADLDSDLPLNWIVVAISLTSTLLITVAVVSHRLAVPFSRGLLITLTMIGVYIGASAVIGVVFVVASPLIF